MTLLKRNTSWEDWPEISPGLFRWPESLGGFFSDHMRIEEYTEGDTYVVRAELPGAVPDRDVKVTVSDGVLHITAERKEEKTADDKGSYRSEFRYGMFSRSIPLPAGVTEDDVKATSSNGIIEVRLPLDKKKADAKNIPITQTS